MLRSTVRLICTDRDGNVSSGTGFYFTFKFAEDKFVPVIVTNRHVFQNAEHCEFKYTLADDNGKSTNVHEGFAITDFATTWIGHPDDSVDLAILPIQQFLEVLRVLGKRPLYTTLTDDIIATEEMMASLDAIEDITMIGYPNSLIDDVNNLPITRRGITATACARHFRGKQEFLIDAAVYPGSSGSPVFIYNQGSYSHGGGITMGTRLMLLGIVFQVFLHKVTGEIISVPIPTSMIPVPVSDVPNNLGTCIQALRLFDFRKVLEKRIAAELEKHSVPSPHAGLAAVNNEQTSS